MEDTQARCPEEHQEPPPEIVHGKDCDDRGDQADGAGDDNIEHQLADSVAGGGKNGIGMRKNDVHAAPLLKKGEHHADQQDVSHFWFEQLAEIDFLDFVDQRCFNLVDRLSGVVRAADPVEEY